MVFNKANWGAHHPAVLEYGSTLENKFYSQAHISCEIIKILFVQVTFFQHNFSFIRV